MASIPQFAGVICGALPDCLLQVLEHRRFIRRGDASREYELNDTMFHLTTGQQTWQEFPGSINTLGRDLMC